MGDVCDANRLTPAPKDPLNSIRNDPRRVQADVLDKARTGQGRHAKNLVRGTSLALRIQLVGAGGGRTGRSTAVTGSASFRKRSTTRAQRRPSAIAVTISDWPTRASPAAKMPF